MATKTGKGGGAAAPRKRPRARSGGAAQLTAMRALAHPLRLRLVELFAEGPRTTKQVAEELGLPPTRLYHHVHALEAAGLLRLRERRKKRGTEEKYYEATPERMEIRHADTAARGRQVAALASSAVEAARLELAGMLAGEVPWGSEDSPLIVRLRVLSDVVAARIRKDLLAVIRRHAGEKATTRARSRQRTEGKRATDPPREGGGSWSLTMLLLPARDRGGKGKR